MKIEHCEWSIDNGLDIHGNTIWYCAHRTFCKNKTCVVTVKQVAEEKPKVIKQEAKKRDAEYYENLIPTIRNLIANGVTTWTNIGKALKTNPNPLRDYYHKHGIKFEGLKVQARDVDWTQIVPIVIAKRKERKPWTDIAAELGIQSEMLRVQMQTEYDIH